MATVIELQTKIDTANSAQALGAINKSLKDLISLQSQFANGSAEYKKLQKAIVDTESKLGDLKDGFATLRGSGVERLNASFGLLREGFVNLDTDKVGIAFKGLGAAMKTIPIFLIAEGVKLLVENFSDLVKWFGIGTKESDKLAASLEKQKKANEALYTVQSNRIKIMQAEGASIESVLAATIKLNNQKIQDAKNDVELQKLKIREIFLNDTITETLQRRGIEILRAQGLNQQADLVEAAIQKDKLKRASELGEAIRTDLVAINNLQTDSKLAEIAVEKKHTEDLKKVNADRTKQFLENEKLISDNRIAGAQIDKDNKKLVLDDLAKDEQEKLRIAQATSDAEYQILVNKLNKEKKLKKDEEDGERDLRDAKFKIALQSAASLQNLSDLAFSIKMANVKKGSVEEEKAARAQFKINKGFAIATTAISGFQGVVNALSAKSLLPEPFASILRTANAVAIGTATAANIAKISATQFNNAGFASQDKGVGGGATSVSGAGASLAPPQPQSLAFNNNTIGAVGGIGGNQANVQKVVLVSHDVTRAQKNDKIIEMQATFG